MSADRIELKIATAKDMQALGSTLACLIYPGDLIILSGELGVGKTQLAKGIGAGLRVDTPVISPTFVLSRIHRSTGDGPMMVHVDAYRLTSRNEIDDLDLEAQMPVAVTVVEWGNGIAEHLCEDRLEIEIQYSVKLDDETRQVSIVPTGSRWDNFITSWERLATQAGRYGDGGE